MLLSSINWAKREEQIIGGGEKRRRAVWRRCQNRQPLNRTLRYAQRSADLECNLDGDLASDGSTVGPISGLKPPVFDRLNGLPFQSRARSLHYLNVFRSAVRSYDNL